MKDKTVWLDRWKTGMLPLNFTFSLLLNFGFYYLGLAFQENAGRKYCYIIGCILFAALSGVTLLYMLRTERLRRHTYLFLCIVLLFYVISLTIGLVRYGTQALFFTYFQNFIVFCLPAFFIGICAAKWRMEKSFVLILEKLSFFALPASLIYFNEILFNCNPFNYGRDLGIIGYMSFSYTLLPLLMAHIAQFADGAPLEIPLLKKQLRHPQVVRGLLILVYWVGIYGSGTRSTMVCVLCFCVLLLLYKVLHRESVKRGAALSCAMVALLLFNMCIYAPPGMRWLQRVDMFIAGLSEGQLITSVEDPSVTEHIDDFVAADPSKPTTPTTPASPGTPTQPDNQEEVLQITSRGTLFKIAYKEFLKSPVTGMGPGGFMEKYQMFPHNAILELLAETGLIGTIPMMLLILFALWKLLVLGWRDRHTQYLLLFLLVYAIRACASGSLWECSALLCALGYGLTYSPPPPKRSPVGESVSEKGQSQLEE